MHLTRSSIPLPRTPIEVASPFLSPRVVDERAVEELSQRLLASARAAARAEQRLAATAQAAATLTARLEQILREQSERIAKVGAEGAGAPMVDGSDEAREALAALLALAADERHHAEQMMIDLRTQRAKTIEARNSASAAAVRAVEAGARAKRAGARLHRDIDRAERSPEVVVTPEARAWAMMAPAGAD